MFIGCCSCDTLICEKSIFYFDLKIVPSLKFCFSPHRPCYRKRENKTQMPCHPFPPRRIFYFARAIFHLRSSPYSPDSTTTMTLSSTYLTAYNGLSCALWTYLTIYTLTSAPALYASGDLHHLHHELLSGGSWSWGLGLLPITQTLALVEILHAAAGLVRASPVTTAIQVGGKNLVVWTVMVAFPEVVVGRDRGGAVGVWPFVGCVVFWGVSEVLRYGYFVVLLVTGEVPGWLKWLRYVIDRSLAGHWEGKLMCYDRYSAFIVLYPPGLISEAWLVYLALTEVTNVGLLYRIYLLLGFLTYIPASYIMYSHMLSQRRRSL